MAHEPAPREPGFAWHTLPVADVFPLLNSAPAGLTGPEAQHRLTVSGPNELQAGIASRPGRSCSNSSRTS